MRTDRLVEMLAEVIVWMNLWTRAYQQQLDALAHLQPVLNELQRRFGLDWSSDYELCGLYDDKVNAELKAHGID